MERDMIFDETKPQEMVEKLRREAKARSQPSLMAHLLEESADLIEDILDVIEDQDSTVAHLADQNQRVRLLATALEAIEAIGRMITDPNNTYGLKMTNIATAALVAHGIEQGSSKPEVADSNPAESAKPTPNAWHCLSGREVLTTDREEDVREFMDRNKLWTVMPLYTRSSALRLCPLDELEAEYVRRSQHTDGVA
jgi:hypothetical protein